MLCLVPCVILCACARNNKDLLTAPQPTLAPYNTDGTEVTWIVTPPRNESGTSTIDILTVGDELVASLEEVRGVRCIPMNRTIDAMRQLQLAQVNSAAQARALATALGADGVIVTTITAYDPYRPTMGIAAALYARSSAMNAQPVQATDARSLARATTANLTSADAALNKPLSVTSAHLDGRNHQVQADVKTYAMGRQRDRSAIEWKRYLQTMPLFVGFSCHFTVSELMKQEWLRMARATGIPESTQSAAAATMQRVD